jgi:hypothetical protein
MDFDPKEAEMKYCGIDLHSNNSVVVVSDEEDRIVFSKRLPNDLAQILSGRLMGVRFRRLHGTPALGRSRPQGNYEPAAVSRSNLSYDDQVH